MSESFLWLLVTTFSGLLSCSAKPHFCITRSGHEEYDDSVKICCNGKITLRVRDQECCGGDNLYFTSISICCGGKIEHRYAPPKGSRQRTCSSNDEQCHEQICCGNAPVDKEDAMCCQQQPVYLNYTQQLERDFLMCCGETVINTLSHFCCGGKQFPRNSVLECCEGKVFDKQAEKCLTTYSPHKILSKYENICGKQKYDMRNNSCCSGTLQDMPEMDPLNPTQNNAKFSCCDTIAYDNTAEKCCRKSNTGFTTHTIVKKPDIYCCGYDSYNATHQDCYKGSKLEKVPGKDRCGYTYIDGEVEQCCSEMVYNTQSHDCCTGDAVSVITKSEICCNGAPSNETVLCCEGITTSHKRKPDDNECCYNFKTKHAQTYNSDKNEHCIQGEVIQLPVGAEACGLLNFYIPASQICCGEKVYNITTRLDSCCGDRPYHSLRQQCCNYEVSNISPQEGSCCHRDFKVYRYDDRSNPCIEYCGNVPFDKTHQICCQGVVHASHDDTECCGSSAISSSTQGCCANLFPWSRHGNIRCCGDKDLYNKQFARCKNDKIVVKDASLRKLSDVQYLCNRTAMKYFDGGIKYACESQYIIKARLVSFKVLENSVPNNTLIHLNFTDVTGLHRGNNFSSLKTPKNLIFNIEIPHDKNIQCKNSYLTRFCKVIIFFNGSFNGGNVNINRHSKFLMTKYSRKREVLITKKLSYKFCSDNFRVQ